MGALQQVRSAQSARSPRRSKAAVDKAVRGFRCHRSSKHIYAQVIDDAAGTTLAAASTMEKDLQGSLKTGANKAAAAAVGKLVAERAVKAGVKEVVFDRGGYLFHGRVKALADAAREGGLKLLMRREIEIVARSTRQRQDGTRGREREERDSEFSDKLVHINRVAKVVKGGKRFGFAALVVVGDLKGRVGFGHGKAREVPEAIRKANEAARRDLVRVPLRERRTLHHDSEGRHGAGKVVAALGAGRYRHHRRRRHARRVRDAGRA